MFGPKIQRRHQRRKLMKMLFDAYVSEFSEDNLPTNVMKFDFVKWNNGEWAVQHPDTTKLGFGATKFQAVKDLEAQVGKLSAR